MLVDNSKKGLYSSDMKLTTRQSIEAFRKLPQAQHDIILRGAELLAAKTGLPLPQCIHVIAECCIEAVYGGLLATSEPMGSERKR